MSEKIFIHNFCFESYGVKVRIGSNSADILSDARETAVSALLGNVVEIDCGSAEQTFFLPVGADGTCSIVQNGENIVTDHTSFRFWKFFNSLVRILVADFAPDMVFIHAGVVGWCGKALIFPGNSFYGKTTLVAELVRCGAEYYSDEYAIFDSNGLVHPFARPLSMRTDGPSIAESHVNIEAIGGKKGISPIPVGCVFFTKYAAESVPDYEFLTPGQGVVQVVGQTIAIKRNTEFAIKVLKNGFSNAIILKSPRPEAAKFAREFLEFVDNTAI